MNFWKTNPSENEYTRIKIKDNVTNKEYDADIRYHNDREYNNDPKIDVTIYGYKEKYGIKSNVDLKNVPVSEFFRDFTIDDNRGGRKSRKSKSRIRRKSNKNRKTRRRRRCGRR